MRNIAVCQNSFCETVFEIESLEDFDYQCPECYDIALFATTLPLEDTLASDNIYLPGSEYT